MRGGVISKGLTALVIPDSVGPIRNVPSVTPAQIKRGSLMLRSKDGRHAILAKSCGNT